MDSGLGGRVVLISGASGGIGGALVRAFHAEGTRVVAQYRSGADRIAALAAELGERVLPVAADLADEGHVAELFRQAVAWGGAVHHLIANAGKWPTPDEPVEQLSLERWQRTLSDNLTSAFLSVREFLKQVRANGVTEPSVVLVGSTAGQVGEAGHADYAAAKAALTGFALSLKNEIARLTPRGRVNVVCPGWTLTPTRPNLGEPSRVRRVLQTVALRKVGRPEDVAAAAVYLASPRLAGHVSGQMLTVAGGMEGRVLYSPEEIDPSGA